MGLVFKISKPGFDVATCADEDLVLSSEFSTLKVAHQDDPESSGDYAHELGYSPAFFVSAPVPNGTDQNTFLGQKATSAFEVSFYSNDTDFHYSTKCKYYLFYQDI